jgi:prolipoprotein diacylglyceryl transferase
VGEPGVPGTVVGGSGGRGGTTAHAPTIAATTATPMARSHERCFIFEVSTSDLGVLKGDPTMPGMAVLASIPSPGDSTIDLGPLRVHIYGLLLALAIVVAARIAMVQWRRHGGRASDIVDIVLVVVVAGVVGARLYHVATDYQLFEDHWLRAFEIWKGGLSIWGAVIGGAIGVVIVTRVKHLDTLGITDAIAPGLFAAQAIGRWGNWFNQELFGKPTDLPWGLEIDPAKRPAGYAQYATFHPVFLYESVYCLFGLVVLLWVDRRIRMRRGQLFALYIAIYCFGRFFFENLRIDRAHEIAGLRVNAWISVVFFGFGVVWFWWLGRHSTTYDEPRPPAGDATGRRGDADRQSGATGGVS